MVESTLAELVGAGFVQRVSGDASVVVHGIKHDSRAVAPGDLFVAIDGARQDGARFARDAVSRGASAVLAERELDLQVPVVIAEDALVALSAVARHLYGDPTSELAAIGITGTNGKTTTAYLLEAILTHVGHVPAVIGTVEFRGPAGVRTATHTTPMADDLMRIARWVADTGASHLILEVSSHGLAMHRTDGVRFRVAAFTNLSQDHLDYHGDLDTYELAKRRLFEDLTPERIVLNVDDPAGARIAAASDRPMIRCTRKPGVEAELRVRSYSSTRRGISATVETPDGDLQLESPLIGDHNLENLLIALGCALSLGIDGPRALDALRGVTGAPGRLERIEIDDDILVFVDYAHTPDALERVLAALRPITTARLWALFGCGGDRDQAKRAQMGRAAGAGADLVLLTNDNPRTESPHAILSQIEAGVREGGLTSLGADELPAAARGFFVEPDRRAAIRLALASATAGDTVLIAGKGHETEQIIGEHRGAFDDRVEAREAVALREAV